MSELKVKMEFSEDGRHARVRLDDLVFVDEETGLQFKVEGSPVSEKDYFEKGGSADLLLTLTAKSWHSSSTLVLVCDESSEQHKSRMPKGHECHRCQWEKEHGMPSKLTGLE